MCTQNIYNEVCIREERQKRTFFSSLASHGILSFVPLLFSLFYRKNAFFVRIPIPIHFWVHCNTYKIYIRRDECAHIPHSFFCHATIIIGQDTKYDRMQRAYKVTWLYNCYKNRTLVPFLLVMVHSRIFCMTMIWIRTFTTSSLENDPHQDHRSRISNIKKRGEKDGMCD